MWLCFASVEFLVRSLTAPKSPASVQLLSFCRCRLHRLFRVEWHEAVGHCDPRFLAPENASDLSPQQTGLILHGTYLFTFTTQCASPMLHVPDLNTALEATTASIATDAAAELEAVNLMIPFKINRFYFVCLRISPFFLFLNLLFYLLFFNKHI